MTELRKKQKIEAIKRMKELHIMQQPIKEFQKEGKVNLSENIGILYYLSDEEQKMVDEFEQKHDALVYHVIKTNTNIGRMYSLLFVSKYTEEWEMDNMDLKNGVAFVYVFNQDMPDCSEFGCISIKPSFGGLMRV